MSRHTRCDAPVASSTSVKPLSSRAVALGRARRPTSGRWPPLRFSARSSRAHSAPPDLWDWPREIDSVGVRRGKNGRSRELTYLLNYSGSAASLPSPVAGASVLARTDVGQGEELQISPWDLAILEG